MQKPAPRFVFKKWWFTLIFVCPLRSHLDTKQASPKVLSLIPNKNEFDFVLILFPSLTLIALESSAWSPQRQAEGEEQIRNS